MLAIDLCGPTGRIQALDAIRLRLGHLVDIASIVTKVINSVEVPQRVASVGVTGGRRAWCLYGRPTLKGLRVSISRSDSYITSQSLSLGHETFCSVSHERAPCQYWKRGGKDSEQHLPGRSEWPSRLFEHCFPSGRMEECCRSRCMSSHQRMSYCRHRISR